MEVAEKVLSERKANALRKLATEDDVEDFFKKNGFELLEKRILAIRQAKGTQFFSTPGYPKLPVEDRYRYELHLFLDARWRRKRELYKKLGFVK